MPSALARPTRASVHARTDALGFLTLPTNTALLEATLAVEARTRGRFDDVLLLGRGPWGRLPVGVE